MAAFNFPSSPTEGQTYTDVASGAQYVFKSPVWMQVSAAQIKATALPRNRIVNPAMQISQENGNTAGLLTAYYAADQWYTSIITSAAGYSVQRVQSVTPNGSKDRFRVTMTTIDAALAAGELLQINQKIEGAKVADFRWGSASAKQVVLRFGFKAPAGTYSVALQNSASNRSYVASFAISAGQANTDTEQTLVIPGDTTGTWLTDSGIGLTLVFALAVGSTFQGVAGWQAGYFMGTSANTNGMGAINIFELYDVGLYLDPDATGVAPKWEMPDEADELAACQRYFIGSGTQFLWWGYGGAANACYGNWYFPVAMRTAPTFVYSGTTYSNASGLGTNLNQTDHLRVQFTITAAGSGYAAATMKALARM